MKSIRLVAVSCALALAFAMTASSASAGLLGDTISGSYDFPTATSTYGNFSYSVNPFVVGAGPESTLFVDGGAATVSVDFSDSSLVLTQLNGVGFTSTAFNGPEFTIMAGNPFDPISSVISSNGSPVTASIVGGVLEVNWQGDGFNPGDTVTVNFGNPVPEPSSLALAGIGGLGALIAAIRRRRIAA